MMRALAAILQSWRRGALVAVALCCAIAGMSVGALAQQANSGPTICTPNAVCFAKGTFTATTTAAQSPANLILSGQQFCAVTIGGNASGFSLTVNGASDFATYSAIATINGGAAITANGTYQGGILSSATTNIALAVSAISSGQITWTIACTTGSALAMGQYNASTPTYTNGQNAPFQMDANGNSKVVQENTCAAAVPGVTSSTIFCAVQAIYPNNPCSYGTLTSIAVSISTATTTQIEALSSGKSIYICKVVLMAGGTGNVTLEYGTGTNCGTGTTTLTGAMPLAAQAGWLEPSGIAPNYTVPASNAFCILTSAAVQISGSVLVVQQ